MIQIAAFQRAEIRHRRHQTLDGLAGESDEGAPLAGAALAVPSIATLPSGPRRPPLTEARGTDQCELHAYYFMLL
jgi:hypothetical protein